MTGVPNTHSIEGLSIAERILLVEEIWDSIVPEQQSVEVTDAQKEELDRRLAAHEADPEAGASWNEVKARLRTKA